MTIGIVGGTGDIGEGIALRLSPIFEVIVGSREIEKAQFTCDSGRETLKKRGQLCSLTGVSNQQAIDDAAQALLQVLDGEASLALLVGAVSGINVNRASHILLDLREADPDLDVLELHALGAPNVVLEMYKKAWEGHLRQYTLAKTTDVPFARDGARLHRLRIRRRGRNPCKR